MANRLCGAPKPRKAPWGGAFVATAHRVRTVREERYSFPLFYACDYHTLIKPLPAFAKEGDEYEELAIGEHMYGQALQT